ncbi:MAG: hypothetical protein RL291_1209 [Pseudomonadota bacterium]
MPRFYLSIAAFLSGIPDEITEPDVHHASTSPRD